MEDRKVNEKRLILEMASPNDITVEQLSALENHLFYHLKEFTKKVNSEGNLNQELSFYVKPLDRLLDGDEYAINIK